MQIFADVIQGNIAQQRNRDHKRPNVLYVSCVSFFFLDPVALDPAVNLQNSPFLLIEVHAKLKSERAPDCHVPKIVKFVLHQISAPQPGNHWEIQPPK